MPSATVLDAPTDDTATASDVIQVGDAQVGDAQAGDVLVGGAQVGDALVGAPNKPPAIADFSATEQENGTFVITGRVVDENPGGLTVTLGGTTSCSGQTTTTEEDGTFTLVVYLRTDGSDNGWITATVQDDHGQVSNEADVYVEPTPP